METVHSDWQSHPETAGHVPSAVQSSSSNNILQTSNFSTRGPPNVHTGGSEHGFSLDPSGVISEDYLSSVDSSLDISGVDESESNLTGLDNSSQGSVEKLGGSVHSNLTWVIDMEAKFMVCLL